MVTPPKSAMAVYCGVYVKTLVTKKVGQITIAFDMVCLVSFIRLKMRCIPKPLVTSHVVGIINVSVTAYLFYDQAAH